MQSPQQWVRNPASLLYVKYGVTRPFGSGAGVFEICVVAVLVVLPLASREQHGRSF